MIGPYRYALTASGGSVSQNTENIRGYIAHLVIIPAASTTSYDVEITDPDGDSIYDRDGVVGTLRDSTKIPVKGVCTVAITSASVATSTFTLKIMLDEIPS